MALDLRDCAFFGPALPEPFVKFQLEGELHKRKLLPKATGDEGRTLQDRWEVYRRKLRALGEQGGDRRVASHVLEPLAERLGYERFEPQAQIITREGPEDGGWLFTAGDGQKLRAWSVGLGVDLDAPSRRGRAYRFSPSRVAQRVLLASGERVGLLTDGEELRLLLCDPARPDSHIAIRLDRSGGWRAARGVPDSYRLLLALASPEGVAAVPDLAEAARLAQSAVTKKLRLQARRAIEGFLQELLDHPANTAVRDEWPDSAALARALWREGLILVYRLLFVFKLESSADPARAFSFASTSLWRNTYSPNTALAPLVRRVLDQGAHSGGFLEGGLRTLWCLFAEGMSSSELEVKPLGGMLFGEGTTPLLDRLSWGERGVARLLDALLWTPGDGKTERERVHYGALDVEDLGRVYEALLELEPGIATEPMCRLRRAKLEVVVPVAQGAPYRTAIPVSDPDDDYDTDSDDPDDDGGAEDEATKRRGKAAAGSKTKVQFIEEIPAERFFLRVGLGRKASGSYYTPHPFVRFLVQETLEPQLAERSPKEDPQPGRILDLKVLDPAMGSGHFLVEACRYLGEALYEACRLCDELAVQAEGQAEKVDEAEREALLAHAAELRKRVEDLPDPDDELLAYLPSRAAEGEESGLSQRKAEAMCRRLVAVHCLYGVDKNPLAVELAKLSLWLESYAEGLPLTFMDHRLIPGDSLTGAFFEHLMTYPKSGEKLDDLFAQGLTERLEAALAAALVHVRDLEASVGKDVADLEHKRAAKEKLDAALAPLKTLAATWSGGVMLGDECDDAGYQALAQAVAAGDEVGEVLAVKPRLREMYAAGRAGVVFGLAFPETFTAGNGSRPGFHAVVGNPPWDRIEVAPQDYFGSLDFSVVEAPNEEARKASMERLATDPVLAEGWETVAESTKRDERIADRLYEHQKVRVGGKLTLGRPDTYRLFVERWVRLAAPETGTTGWIVPSSFHSNEGATGVRRLYLTATCIISCFSFENRRKLFDIDSRFKFVLLVARRSARGTSEFVASFYLCNPAVLFSPDDRSRQVRLSRSTVREITGDHECFPEVRTSADLGLALAQARTSVTTWGQFLADAGVKTAFGVELHRNPDFALSLPIEGPTAAILAWANEQAWQHLPLHAGKTIFQYTDEFDASPTNMVRTSVAVGTRHWGVSTPGYRLAFRMKAASTNERSMISVLITPGFVCEQTLAVETQPLKRPNHAALLALSIANSFMFDWQVRQRITTSLSNYLLAPVPLPSVQAIAIFAVHCALRLTCNHSGYEPLWTEQLGDWRESTPKHTWPVLEGDDARWALRAAIDAVVADAYGLDRAQYEHVLSTFSHRSYPKAPALCLAAFEELKALGLEAFTQKHDPYWDIPLNESLPKPVIDLPLAGEKVPAPPNFGPLFGWSDGEAAEPAETETPRSTPRVAPRPAWMARTPIDRQVLILSRVVDAHQRADRLHTLGNVKAEKVIYLVEAHAGVDLERAPVREAAGPADFPRLKKVVHRGAKLHAFSVRGGAAGSGGVWSPGGGLRKWLGEYNDLFSAERPAIDCVIDLLVPMDSEQAEIVATLYACWNDLLARGAQADDASVIADFHSWAEGKRRFDADRLGKALQWMRQHDLVPSGSAPSTRTRDHEGRREARSQDRSTASDDEVYALMTSLLEERGVISSKDAQEATGLDAAGVRPHLERLVDEGLAVTEGQRRGMKYRRADG